MFGIFHKNTEKEFKLDTEKLPSLSEIDNNQNINSQNQFSNDLDSPFNNSNVNSNYSNPFENQNNQFNQSINNATFNPNQNLNNFQNQNFDQNNLNNSQNELIQAKINNIETNLALLKSKTETIESKLDLILKILEYEISDSTKEKLKLNSIQNTLHNKL